MSLKSCRGFTLIELIVSISCASILVLTAWNTYGLFQRDILKSTRDYNRKFFDLVIQMSGIIKNARDYRECSSNRFWN